MSAGERGLRGHAPISLQLMALLLAGLFVAQAISFITIVLTPLQVFEHRSVAALAVRKMAAPWARRRTPFCHKTIALMTPLTRYQQQPIGVGAIGFLS